MGEVERVLVVGAGIAGLSASTALGQVGIGVDLVEIQPAPSSDGTGIQQPGNAIRAFKALGLLDQLREQGYRFKRSGFCDAAGNVLSTTTHDPHEELAGNGIARPRLHDILAKAALDNGTIFRTALTVDALEQTPDRVEVLFSDGTSGSYDLVIGADGINSKVRHLVFGDEPSPRFTGEMVWRCNVPRLPSVEGTWIYMAIGARAGVIPIADDLMYVFLIESPRDGEMRIADEHLAEVFRDRLAGYGGIIAQVRDGPLSEPQPPILHRPLESLMLTPDWYRGRVVIIGDAAHAMTPHLGQGAAQAVEDGLVLSRLLARGGQRLAVVLEEFMARRHDRCKEALENSLQLGQWEVERRTDADFVGVANRVWELNRQPFFEDLEQVR
ncbi:MAG TPA: FAD-dependent monooxygenase [Solirubrobacteraceae bacterium]|jgi:2-polyprenyl-6-methoxyphenol hydroxylase-like FAD-dependent oxidoreductase